MRIIKILTVYCLMQLCFCTLEDSQTTPEANEIEKHVESFKDSLKQNKGKNSRAEGSLGVCREMKDNFAAGRLDYNLLTKCSLRLLEEIKELQEKNKELVMNVNTLIAKNNESLKEIERLQTTKKKNMVKIKKLKKKNEKQDVKMKKLGEEKKKRGEEEKKSGEKTKRQSEEKIKLSDEKKKRGEEEIHLEKRVDRSGFILTSSYLEVLDLSKVQLRVPKVTIINNKNLCYLEHFSTLNTLIYFIVRGNKDPKACIREMKVCSAYCNPKKGCWGPTSRDCFECRFVANGSCVDRCESRPGFFTSNQGNTCGKCHKDCKHGCFGPAKTQCHYARPYLNEYCPNHMFFNTASGQCKECATNCFGECYNNRSEIDIRVCTGPGDWTGPGGCNFRYSGVELCTREWDNCSSACNPKRGCFGPHRWQCYECRWTVGNDCVDSCDNRRGFFTPPVGRICGKCHEECKHGCFGPNRTQCHYSRPDSVDHCSKRMFFNNDSKRCEECAKECQRKSYKNSSEPTVRICSGPGNWTGPGGCTYLGVKLFLLSVPKPVFFEKPNFYPEFEETGEKGMFYFIKYYVRGICPGFLSFEELRDVLQPLYHGTIRLINQYRGFVNSSKLVADVTTKDEDKLIVDKMKKPFCDVNGTEFSSNKNISEQEIKSKGHVLISGGGRRTVLFIWTR